MIQELADQIWANPDYHEAAAEIELAWLRQDLGTGESSGSLILADKLIRAAAILACSNSIEHKRSAFRVATCAYELFGSSNIPLDQALRVVLARLGNFAAFGTRPDVEGALSKLPTSLVMEEILSGEDRAVEINGETVYLTDFQRNLWRSLERKDRVALAAPTSAGKSFVLEGYLASLFNDGDARSVIYLVPTRALIAQVSDDLHKQFKALGTAAPSIVSVPVDGDTELPNRAVYVMTQERVQVLVSNHPQFSAELIVIDEAHSIAEDSRGVLLQWVIDDLLEKNSQAQILFASPNVKNLDVFSRLFGLESITLFSSAEPTVAQNFLLTKVVSAVDGQVKISTVGDGSRDASEVGDFTLGRTIANRTEKLVHIAAALGRDHSNIIYANGAAEAELIALQLAEAFADREQTPARLALSELASEAVHSKYALVECAKVGVAFHYSNIPTHLRRRGQIQRIVSTLTSLRSPSKGSTYAQMLSENSSIRLSPSGS